MKLASKIALGTAACLPIPLAGCITVQCPCACHATDAAHDASAAPTIAAPTAAAAARPRRSDIVPPPLIELDSIPVNDALAKGRKDVWAVFEVDGDELVGVAYTDRRTAEGALGLWRELVLRIPTNQRLDLVQLEIAKASDPAGSTDNSGTGSATGRFGYVMSFSRSCIGKNDPDPTAPLERRRGTFDWTLIHEFGHLRMYADGATDDYVPEFGTGTGPGHGYPEDGSPRTEGSWVTSYAERAGGDEDCAESFTTYVMLDELPAGDSPAARKVRWFADRPGYPELRRALRITEPDGSTAPLDPSPRAEFPLVVEPAAWMVGTWSGTLADGTAIVYEITSDDIVRTRHREGSEVERWSYRNLREVEPFTTVDLYEVDDDFYLHQVSVGGRSFSESFRPRDGKLLVENERLGEFTLEPTKH